MVIAAALILAGGQSRRMGRDKALLPMATSQGPLPLLRRTCDVAMGCVDRTYVLTPWPQRYASLLPPTAVLLQESGGGGGPLVALAQGWVRILADSQRRGQWAPDWLLVLACDLPAIDLQTLSRWQGELDAVSEIAALPRHQDRWEPLCGFYHRRCIPSLQRAIAAKIYSYQGWLAQEEVFPLPVTNSNVLQNCNTPSQWQHFLHSRAR
ncbi:MAG: molybdenum cofactor guanylyltransferase [Cyanobacteria bacterium P01_H01_bin.26]